MYLTFLEYQAFGGALDELSFEKYEYEAEVLINYATFNRLKHSTNIPYEVKRLVNYLIDLAKKQSSAFVLGTDPDDANGTANITSQSNDGVSVSYNGLAASDAFELCKSEADDAIKMYLSGVTNELGKLLLYRGLYPGE